MGMRARLERDLKTCKQVRTNMEQFTGELGDHFDRSKRVVARRIHLLEFVLSGRYAAMQRVQRLRDDPWTDDE